jgi:hypothetical protein
MRYLIALLLLPTAIWSSQQQPAISSPAMANTEQLQCGGQETSFFAGTILAGETQEEEIVICEYYDRGIQYYAKSKRNGKILNLTLKRHSKIILVGKNGKYTYRINTKTKKLSIRHGRQLKQTKQILVAASSSK